VRDGDLVGTNDLDDGAVGIVDDTPAIAWTRGACTVVMMVPGERAIWTIGPLR
jgi:hypothetical protein